MGRILAVLFFGLIVEAIGVVYLGKGLKEIGEPARLSFEEIGRLLVRGATNANLLRGVALEAAYFGCILYMMSQADVSFVWPVTALGFFLTTLFANLILHEYVSPLRWLGVSLIVVGAGLITYTETVKQAGHSGRVPGARGEGGLPAGPAERDSREGR